MRSVKRVLAVLMCLCLSVFACGEETRYYTAGYGEAPIRAELTDGTAYYVAGYRNDNPAKGILDDQYAKAFYISDGNSSVLLISIDCVAISSTDTERIREALAVLCAEAGISAVHVISTHDHSGVDTLGLWGPVGRDGKNKGFSERMRAAAVQAAYAAYEDRTEGELFFGFAQTDARACGLISDLQDDTRLPRVYDPNLYCFRFVPVDGGSTIRILNYAAHAESLDGDNNMISADYPGVVAHKIKEADGGSTIWIPGAIGGLIRTRFLINDRLKNCERTGEILAERALLIDNYEKLPVRLAQASAAFSAPCENVLFSAMHMLGVLEQAAHRERLKLYIDTEMSVLELGGKTILMLPGEIFPELVYGDKTGFSGCAPEKTLEPLTSVFGNELLIFGLADNEIGYIVAPDNFMLNEKLPYIERVRDINGEDHYEETNSLGPKTAEYILETAKRLKTELTGATYGTQGNTEN